MQGANFGREGLLLPDAARGIFSASQDDARVALAKPSAEDKMKQLRERVAAKQKTIDDSRGTAAAEHGGVCAWLSFADGQR